MQNLRSAILEWLPTLDPFTFISLVSFDTSVSLHHLASPDPSSSDPTPRLFSLTLPGSRPLDPALLASHLCGPQAGSHLCGGSLGPGGQAAQLSVQLGAGGLEAVRLALASIRPMEVDLPLAHRPRSVCMGVGREMAWGDRRSGWHWSAFALWCRPAPGSQGQVGVQNGFRMLVWVRGDMLKWQERQCQAPCPNKALHVLMHLHQRA